VSHSAQHVAEAVIWNSIKPEIEQLFTQQWADPELPCMEYRSSARLIAWLDKHGFEVERQAGGVPTAFVARRSLGVGPVIGFLCEYDALPGLGNAASPERAGTGQAAGHACGHNHIGPANAGAAILAAMLCQKLGVPGEIRVIGCPAEEILWGKIAFLKAGVFDGIDVILTSHGDYQTGALSRPCQSVTSGEFVFNGEAGHGGQQGHRNALLIAEQIVASAETICAETFPAIRLRHVLRRAGIMPSITPAESRVWFTTRGYDLKATQDAYAAIVNEAEKIAREGGVTFREQFISESRGYLPNDTIGRLLFENMSSLGPPQWTESDIAFMRSLVANCSPGGEMTLDRDVRYFDSGEDYYGQDDGEVSWRIPLGRVNWAYPEEVPIHHWAWTALSGHPASSPGPLLAARTLAQTAVRLLTSPAIIDAAKGELKERVKGIELGEPRLGAFEVLTKDPQSFWDSTWVS
jgi:aminobenzoyl-glutamate utilization protein B